MYRFDFAPLAMRAIGLGAAHGSELDHVMARGGERDAAAGDAAGWRPRGAGPNRSDGRRVAALRADGRDARVVPAFDGERRRTWVFDRVDRLEEDARGGVRAAWQSWQPYG